jgi:excinuclease UvrABC ATPase subunit
MHRTPGQSGCILCKAGYYANETGQATCSECQGGTATISGSFSVGDGSTSCTLCTGYKFQNFPRK